MAPPPPRKRTKVERLLRPALFAVGVVGMLWLGLVGLNLLDHASNSVGPVADTSVRSADLRAALPSLVPFQGATIESTEVTDVRCRPLSPAQATEVLRVPEREEQVELVARRNMADVRWRDLPDRSTIGPKSVTMRFEHGVGDGSGTVTYVLTGDGDSTTVRVSLVGSIHGRCGVR